MKKILNAIKCFLGFHRFWLYQKFTNNVGRFKCKCCKRDVVVHFGMQCSIPYTDEVHKIYPVSIYGEPETFTEV